LTARGRAARLAGILFLLFAGIVAWAFLGVERPSREERSEKELRERVLPFTPSEVVEIRLTGGADARLVRSEGGWTIAAPDALPADPSAVNDFLERLASIRRKAAVAPPDGGLAAFGLDPPLARLSIGLSGGRTLSLEIGSANPFDHTLFARTGGEVVVLPVSARAALSLDPAALRSDSAPDGGNRG